MTPARLEAQALAVARGGRVLVEALTFSAAPGSFTALTGPNGAGKTSLLRVLAGFSRPAAGAVRVSEAERLLEPDEAQGRIHVLGHRDGLKPGLSVAAHLAFWAGLLGGRADPAALERVGLAAMAAWPARTLSAGQGRRLALARLIAVPRPIWLLDEPAAALDAAGKALLTELLAAHCASGGLAIAALHEPLALAAHHTIDLAPA